MKSEKNKKTHKKAPTMQWAAANLGLPYWLLQEAKRAGCPAFESSGRVDILKFVAWVDYEWYPMPDCVYGYFIARWQAEIRPTLVKPLGIANSFEEASQRTGLSVSMLRYMKDAGSKAFLDE